MRAASPVPAAAAPGECTATLRHPKTWRRLSEGLSKDTRTPASVLADLATQTAPPPAALESIDRGLPPDTAEALGVFLMAWLQKVPPRHDARLAAALGPSLWWAALLGGWGVTSRPLPPKAPFLAAPEDLWRRALAAAPPLEDAARRALLTRTLWRRAWRYPGVLSQGAGTPAALAQRLAHLTRAVQDPATMAQVLEGLHMGPSYGFVDAATPHRPDPLPWAVLIRWPLAQMDTPWSMPSLAAAFTRAAEAHRLTVPDRDPMGSYRGRAVLWEILAKVPAPVLCGATLPEEVRTAWMASLDPEVPTTMVEEDHRQQAIARLDRLLAGMPPAAARAWLTAWPASIPHPRYDAAHATTTVAHWQRPGPA